MQQIERQEHQLWFIGMASAHLSHQPIEVGSAPRIDQDQLAVVDRVLAKRLHPVAVSIS